MDIPEESEYLNITGIAYKGIFDVNYVTFSDSDGTEQIENDDIRYQRDINGHYFVNNLLEGIIQQYEDITDIYFSFEIV
jgi:hypothetical protein